MKKDLEKLLIELKEENFDKAIRLTNNSDMPRGQRIAVTSKYNNTLDIIKRIEDIISKY